MEYDDIGCDREVTMGLEEKKGRKRKGSRKFRVRLVRALLRGLPEQEIDL
jgi:hypothetical protein